MEEPAPAGVAPERSLERRSPAPEERDWMARCWVADQGVEQDPAGEPRCLRSQHLRLHALSSGSERAFSVRTRGTPSLQSITFSAA